MSSGSFRQDHYLNPSLCSFPPSIHPKPSAWMHFGQKESRTRMHSWETLLWGPWSSNECHVEKVGLGAAPHRHTDGKKQKVVGAERSEGGEVWVKDNTRGQLQLVNGLLEVGNLSTPSWNWAISVSKPYAHEGCIAKCLLTCRQDNRRVTGNLRIHRVNCCERALRSSLALGLAKIKEDVGSRGLASLLEGGSINPRFLREDLTQLHKNPFKSACPLNQNALCFAHENTHHTFFAFLV